MRRLIKIFIALVVLGGGVAVAGYFGQQYLKATTVPKYHDRKGFHGPYRDGRQLDRTDQARANGERRLLCLGTDQRHSRQLQR